MKDPDQRGGSTSAPGGEQRGRRSDDASDREAREVSGASEPVGGLSCAQEGMSRRRMLWRLGQTALVGTGFGVGAAIFYDPKNPIRPRTVQGRKLPFYGVPVSAGTPRVVEARGKDPVTNVRAALRALGGLGQFIKRGDRVLVKPNAAFDRTPALGANASPEVVGEVVRLCVAAGARQVLVQENTLFDAKRCFESSGIGDAVRKAGGKVQLLGEDDYVQARVDGMVLDTWPVLKSLFKVDKVINIPTAKHHRSTRVSLGMKNWMGAIGGQRRKFHQKLDLTITDIAAVIVPTLVVLDASRLLMRHGPTGGSLSDVAPGNAIIAGWDQVAVDHQALPLMGTSLSEVRHISTAARRGLGKLHLSPRERVTVNTDV